MGNQIRGGKMSENSALAHATKLVDFLEEQKSFDLFTKNEYVILRLELRFLIAFLKYTADRCTEYKNWQGLLTRIEDVGQHMNKLYGLVRTFQARYIGDGVRDVVDKIKLVKSEITQVQMRVSLLSASSSGSRLTDELVFGFIDSLLEDLKKLLGCTAADSIQPSLKEGVKALRTKLTSLKGLLSFTAKRCNDPHKLNQLFTLAQATADAAYLAYSCLISEMDDEDMASRLALQLSVIVRRIDPRVMPEVREIYVGVLEASKSSGSKSDTYEVDETLVHFVDFLLETTSELLYHDNITATDQIETLYEELKSFRFLLKDAERLTKNANSNDLLAEMEAIAIDAMPVIFSLFEDEVSQETRFALSKLLDNFKLVSKTYVKTSATARLYSHPTTDVLGTLGLLLRDLKELLVASDDSINLLKDCIRTVHRDMEFLGSFLTTLKERRHEHEELENLWRRIINVMFEVEYVIDLVLIKDGPVLHHKFRLSYLIEEIELIKIEISEIQFSEMNIFGLKEHNVQTRSSSHVLSRNGAPRIDEEMVGFKDEEEKLIGLLLWGSEQLQIVSIVGMAGLGKTFLAQKIYNNLIIKNHFYVHAWSSVSQVYQRKGLLINILSQLKKFTEEKSEMTNVELAAELYKCLKGQRYLIVLDDVWDIEAWEALKKSFPNDDNGSRIVFTSRLPELASQAKSDCEIHRLRLFSDSESWELLKKKIFQIESCPSELVEVGRHIAKCCNGLPLAVVVVAGLLARTVKEEDRWRKVADGLSSHIIGDPQRKCLDILDLSYKNLPDYLKPCFLYLATFLEDKEIPVRKLTWLWIAEGFVQDEKPNLENVAETYLMDLIGRSLVIASKKRSRNGLKTCIIHDLVREFCLAKGKEENFLKLIERSNDLPSWTSSESNVPTSPSTSYEQRRLLVHPREGKLNWSKSFGPYVRSLLFNFPRRMDVPTIELVSIIHDFGANEFVSIIHRLKLLRVLDLVNIVINPFPEGIESLVLLRYLAISTNDVVPPQSIASLRNLETLIIQAEDFRSRFGDIILNLNKLRHLFVASSSALSVSGFIESLQLDSLRTLSVLPLSYGDYVKIMRRFPNLEKLSCTLEGPWGCSSKCIWLLPPSQLESLKLVYTHSGSFSQRMSDACGICLPSNIRKLTVSRFGLPWEQISIIAKLPNLEVLKLLSYAFEGEQWTMQEGDFEKLKVLKLRNLDIRRLTVSDDSFPTLERLILEDCDRLEEIPSSLADIYTLKVIRVYRCNASLESSIKQIQEEQREYSNELEIEIKR